MGHQFGHVEKVVHMTDGQVEVILHMTDCHVEKNSPHEKCEENLWKTWRNNVYNVWCFVAFYVILFQNQFFL